MSESTVQEVAATTTKNRGVELAAQRYETMLDRVSTGYLSFDLTLSHHSSHQVYNRRFYRTIGAIFRTDVVITRFLNDSEREKLLEVESAIAGLIDRFEEQLKEQMTQLNVFMEQHSVSNFLNYTNELKASIKLASPQSRRFVTLLIAFDNMLKMVDALWFAGVYDNKQRDRAAFEWRQRLLKLVNRLIHIEGETMRYARGLGKDAELDQIEVTAEERQDDQEAESTVVDEKVEDESKVA